MAKDDDRKKAAAKKAAAKKAAAKKAAAKKAAAKKAAAKKPAAKKPAAKKPGAKKGAKKRAHRGRSVRASTGKTYRPVTELVIEGNRVVGVRTSEGTFTFAQLTAAGDKIGLSLDTALVEFIQNHAGILKDGTCTQGP